MTRAIFVPWRGAGDVRAADALVVATSFAFDESSFAFGEAPVLAVGCESFSSTAMAFSPAAVSFSEYS